MCDVHDYNATCMFLKKKSVNNSYSLKIVGYVGLKTNKMREKRSKNGIGFYRHPKIRHKSISNQYFQCLLCQTSANSSYGGETQFKHNFSGDYNTFGLASSQFTSKSVEKWKAFLGKDIKCFYSL